MVECDALRRNRMLPKGREEKASEQFDIVNLVVVASPYS